MAKPDVSQEPDYAAAILEHFQALTYEEQVSVLDQLQEHVRVQAADQLAELEKRMAALRKVAGLPAASADQSAGERRAGNPRGAVAIKYYDPATGNKSTGRGSMAGWLKAKQEAGEDLSRYLVTVDNPLPPTLV